MSEYLFLEHNIKHIDISLLLCMDRHGTKMNKYMASSECGYANFLQIV